MTDGPGVATHLAVVRTRAVARGTVSVAAYALLLLLAGKVPVRTVTHTMTNVEEVEHFTFCTKEKSSRLQRRLAEPVHQHDNPTMSPFQTVSFVMKLLQLICSTDSRLLSTHFFTPPPPYLCRGHLGCTLCSELGSDGILCLRGSTLPDTAICTSGLAAGTAARS